MHLNFFSMCLFGRNPFALESEYLAGSYFLERFLVKITRRTASYKRTRHFHFKGEIRKIYEGKYAGGVFWL